MKKLVLIGLAVFLLTGTSPIFAESANIMQETQSGNAAETKNKLSRHVYVVGFEEEDLKSIRRFEDDSFPLIPEFTVAIDGETVKYGKYKPVMNYNAIPAIPLLQTIKAAGIHYEIVDKFYVFSNNNKTYKIAFDGLGKMQVLKDGIVVMNDSTGAYESKVFEDEIFVNPEVLLTIFNKDDRVKYDLEDYRSREHILNLYSKIDKKKEMDKANAALRKVIDTLPPEYYLEMKMPSDEKEALKARAMEITKGITNDYDKVKAIHKWVAMNVAYDMDVFHNNFNYIKQVPVNGVSEAYKQLQIKRGLCSSYAELTNQLLKVIGIPARSVAADATHVWVEAYVGNKWVATDPTWDASDAVVDGKLIKGYFTDRGFNNLALFDFDPSVRYQMGYSIYFLDTGEISDNFDPTVYAKWLHNSPNAPKEGGKNTTKPQNMPDPTPKPPKPVNNELPDPRPILLPSGTTNSSGTFIPRVPYTADNVGIGINGKIVPISPSARILNGSTFIPLRGVFENVGATVSWNDSDKLITIVKDATTIKLQIGNKTAYVDGKPFTLETAPFISPEGSTYVPLRFISETIGAKVGWDQNNYVALIVTKKY